MTIRYRHLRILCTHCAHLAELTPSSLPNLANKILERMKRSNIASLYYHRQQQSIPSQKEEIHRLLQINYVCLAYLVEHMHESFFELCLLNQGWSSPAHFEIGSGIGSSNDCYISMFWQIQRLHYLPSQGFQQYFFSIIFQQYSYALHINIIEGRIQSYIGIQSLFISLVVRFMVFPHTLM
ncbi:Hypothetical_protein [Hexamita inflata]|uniref:Hypothetical_protein n=1 Tax=Hexamita inflata TaxID=28002 RepID=A0AA86QPY3_9EUKA|nr:Hypothetical protein HINF_LOCUS44679 [Hexamita inflata]